MRQRVEATSYSKTLMLCTRLHTPGPSHHAAFNWVFDRSNRNAVAALLCGDLFLGVHAGNFFAKAFLPQRRAHLLDAANLMVEPSRVCIHCWHFHRQMVTESEGHALFECSRYKRERAKCFDDISETTKLGLDSAPSGEHKLMLALGSYSDKEWNALGCFCGRVRQSRRRLRQLFIGMTRRLEKQSYAVQKHGWQARGRFVCRHGVFFRYWKACPCLTSDSHDHSAWADAEKMPYLDEELKALTTTPFNRDRFERLGVLQARLRRQDW